MKTFEITRTTYKFSDFLSWQREGRLVLSPAFQRRPVWTEGHKSYLIDTVVRGLPIPVIFLRERIDLDSKEVTREVVDGQQRLRTLMSFVEPSVLPDYVASRDAFTVKAGHNLELAGKSFEKLPSEIRERILTYEFSTHVLPLGMEDRDVLEIFARMNSTGLKLTHQELRNAKFTGPFKTLMYELALEQLDRWRQWRLFNEDQIARMREVETTSDFVMNMIDGLTGKSQARLEKLYAKYEVEFPESKTVADRFRIVIDTIDRLIGPKIPRSAYRSEVNFFTLFVFVYERLYGLGSPLRAAKPRSLPDTFADCLFRASERLLAGDVPAEVLDAIRRASTDIGRRRTRLEFLSSECND